MISELLSKDENGQTKLREIEKLEHNRNLAKRVEAYRKMVDRDCYGYKRAKHG